MLLASWSLLLRLDSARVPGLWPARADVSRRSPKRSIGLSGRARGRRALGERGSGPGSAPPGEGRAGRDAPRLLWPPSLAGHFPHTPIQDLEDLYRPTSLQLLGKNFVFGRKSRVVDLNLLKEEVRLYSCTPRNFSVSVREELKRTDTIFWPGCLLVKRCGGNCACCLHTCSECQCVPSKVTKKYHEVLQLRPKTGVRGLHKSLTDVALEHHEECDCVCRGNPGG